MAEIKNRPGERIEPLPEIKPYESFAYDASTMRSPFVPSAPARSDVANAYVQTLNGPASSWSSFR